MLGTLSCTRALSASAPAPSEHTLLEQALSNLVDNAIRYNRTGGHAAGLRAEIRHRGAAQG
jgi:signal transduction histidine kinase